MNPGFARYAVVAATAAVVAAALGGLGLLGARGGDQPERARGVPEGVAGSITVYCGRSRELVLPVLERFERETGISVRVRYGQTAELAGLILEEGARTPADVFLAQDAAGLGALARAGRLRELPTDLLDRVEPAYRSPAGLWVGVSGRARTIVYNTERVRAEELPASILELAGPQWRGRIAWAPANGSFQAHVTAMRLTIGQERTERWLRGIVANRPRVHPNNVAIVRAVGAGESDVGLTNHYYLHRFKQENPAFTAENHYAAPKAPGSLVNVSAVGVLERSRSTPETRAAAHELVRFLLSEPAQRHFADETFEYPLAAGVEPGVGLAPIPAVQPDVDLSDLTDLEGTLRLLRRVGALP